MRLKNFAKSSKLNIVWSRTLDTYSFRAP